MSVSLRRSPPVTRCVARAGAAQQATMTFFVTSHGPGKGADLGGLAGADAHCAAAGAIGRRGRQDLARLSVDARRRRGERARPHRQGPLDQRQGRRRRHQTSPTCTANNNLTKQTALSEKGEVINGRGDTPNRHDILTGSQPDGTAFADAPGPHLQELDEQHARARRCSATPTAWVCATTPRRIPGTRRIRRAVRRRLHPGRAALDRRRRPAVLLRNAN